MRGVRILHVNKFLHRRGGAESYMLDLAERQRSRGDRVSFFAMEHPDNQADPNQDLFPSRMELNPPPDGLLGRARTAGQILYRPDARSSMEAVLERDRPDVVHLHNIYHQLSPSILRPIARRGVPAVMTLHDYKLVCPTYQFLDHGQICEACLPGRFREAAKRRCNNGSTFGSALSALELRVHTSTRAYSPVRAFLCPSDFLRAKMAEGGVFPDRLVHLPNFCDVTGLTPATEPGRGILYAGRLSPEKGVDVLLEAAALLPPDLAVTIAGDGPARADLERLAQARGLGERVRFLGRIPGADLHAQMRRHAVVVVPSRWYENQPMSVLEAYGCGRPVVASDLGGMSEQIEDEVTGRLVPYNDPRALAEAVDAVVSDPARAHEMGRAARARAEQDYGIDRHLQDLDVVYRGVGVAMTGNLRESCGDHGVEQGADPVA